MTKTLSTEINQETMLKLIRRSARAGLEPHEAVKVIATKGVKFFLALLVGAPNADQLATTVGGEGGVRALPTNQLTK